MGKVFVSGAQYSAFAGFAHLSAGLCCGLSGLAAGMAIGVVGDAGVRAVSAGQALRDHDSYPHFRGSSWTLRSDCCSDHVSKGWPDLLVNTLHAILYSCWPVHVALFV